ncbi:hypothetical protein KN825_15750, partial [Weizmannia coagulans]|nr:hypothetical protein [Heyndrickxia coagulans]
LASTDSLLLHGKIFHMHYAAHILNLIVKEGLNAIGVGVEKIQENVAYWSTTPLRVDNLKMQFTSCNFQTIKS